MLLDRGFLRACSKHEIELSGYWTEPAEMAPIPAARAWNVPAIRTPGELAAWLGIAIGELDWFADCRRLNTKNRNGRLRHYHCHLLSKRFGQIRLVEAPKQRLKEIQRRILVDILDHVPVHMAAHGFRRGRSIKSFAAPHVGKQVVLRIDLRDFFPSISAARVSALFRAIGYPDSVSQLLAGICTTATPLDIWDDCQLPLPIDQLRDVRHKYSQRHLPQGAPTSPALANLCAYRLDCRLSGLATAAGAVYTRYADDLAFSGNDKFARSVKRFHLHACATAMEEGFQVNYRKTRIMRGSVRQRLAGIVVNDRLNISRADYDRLKATLTNCIRKGASSQNRDQHENFHAYLLGRISFVAMINEERGRRLRQLFDEIQW